MTYEHEFSILFRRHSWDIYCSLRGYLFNLLNLCYDHSNQVIKVWFQVFFRDLWSIQDITIFPKYVCIKALLRYLSIKDVSKMYWYMILIIFVSRYIVYLKNVLIWRNLCVWKSRSMVDFKGESPIYVYVYIYMSLCAGLRIWSFFAIFHLILPVE